MTGTTRNITALRKTHPYGTATLNGEGVVSNGKVTGGTGTFKGATGKFTVKTLNTGGTRHAVTFTYHG